MSSRKLPAACRIRILSLLLLLWSALTQAEVVIHAGALIDVESGRMLENQSIIIEDGLVIAVEDGLVAADQVIDLTGSTVMPGWIDMHVHLAGESNPNKQLEAFTLNPIDFAFRSAQ